MSKASVTSAVGFAHPFTLSDDCLTTSNFFINKPVYFHEYTKGERWRCNFNNIIQLLPLQKPIFADVDIKTAAFFVPYRTVMRDWNAFITNTVTKNNAVFKVPYTYLSYITKMFFNTDLAQWTALDLRIQQESDIFDRTAFDFCLYPYDTRPGSLTYVMGANLTKKGRVFYDILLGLGFNLSFSEYSFEVRGGGRPDPVNAFSDITFHMGSYSQDVEDEEKTIMPILAYAKMILDWWTNSQYSNLINSIEASLETLGYVTSTPRPVSTESLGQLMNFIYYTYYPSDAFVDSWEQPLDTYESAPMASSIHLQDISQPNGDNFVTTDGFPTGDATPNAVLSSQDSDFHTSVTSYLTLALQKVSAFCRRNQISGARVIDRYLAHFGKKLDETQTNRCYCIMSHSQRIGVRKVTNLADTAVQGTTQGMPLADFAGDAESRTAGSVSWSGNEYGCIIIVNYITPYIKYYEGLRPHTDHLVFTDFLQSEFDGLGCKAISARNIYNSGTNYITNLDAENANPAQETPLKQRIFGWLPQYWDFKTNPYCTVSGFFRLNSKNTGLDAWNLFRKIDTVLLNTNNWRKGEYFTIGITDASQYNRIFNDTTEDTDKFIIAYHFDVSAEINAMPLYDDLLLNQEFDAEHKGRTDLRVNGTSLR